MKPAALVLVAISFALPSARAADEFRIFGAGGKRCSDYLTDRRQSNKAADLAAASWTWGYVSAHNRANKSAQVGDLPFNAVLAFLDQHCREHPSDVVGNGVEALIRAKQK